MPIDLSKLFTPAGKALAALLVAALLVALLLAWGQSRYDAGVSDTDAKWRAAGRRLEEQARASGRSADVREADRIENHTAAVAAEKEKIDEAVAAGDSPLDVLFRGR